ncbi:hypothetical protein ACFWTC_38565 [Streptomyces sp. NPDC058619]|uniref:hypothetical protein n=1 Tax=unclassified Streptomyces TaxID=2593676 RepID=UPI0036594CD6
MQWGTKGTAGIATAALLTLGSPAIAQPDPTPAPNSLSELVSRSLEEPNTTTQPLPELPPGAWDQVLAEIREINLARHRVLWKFQAAKPEWQDLTSKDLLDFENWVCGGIPSLAADMLLLRLPGVQQADASLLAEAVGLIRCASPQELDEASNTLLIGAMSNTIKAGSSASTQAPTSATKDIPAGMNDIYKVACNTASGTVVAKLSHGWKARSFKLADLFTAAAGALGAYGCTKVNSDLVANLQK